MVSVDPSATEYELRGLKADTPYLVVIRLFNEAGTTERRTRVKTQKERLGRFISVAERWKSRGTRFRHGPEKKVAIDYGLSQGSTK